MFEGIPETYWWFLGGAFAGGMAVWLSWVYSDWKENRNHVKR